MIYLEKNAVIGVALFLSSPLSGTWLVLQVVCLIVLNFNHLPPCRPKPLDYKLQNFLGRGASKHLEVEWCPC